MKDMAKDMANDMANEPTPLFDRVISKLGNPVPAEPIDRSYEKLVEIAEAGRGAAPGAGSKAAAPPLPSVPAPAQSSDAATSMAG